MEANKKRAKVHMLPTSDYPAIGRSTTDWGDGEPKKLYGWLNCAIRTPHDLHHLYFTTDEAIKEGDWYIHPDATVPQNDFSHVFVDCRKIIASTDPKFTLEGNHIDYAMYPKETYKHKNGIPQPTQDFIEAYCKQGGIEYVDVEYVKIYKQNGSCLEQDITGRGMTMTMWERGKTFERPKVDPLHNTITTLRIEEKMYNETELENILNKVTKDMYQALKCKVVSMEDIDFNAKKWIKKNL